MWEIKKQVGEIDTILRYKVELVKKVANWVTTVKNKVVRYSYRYEYDQVAVVGN